MSDRGLTQVELAAILGCNRGNLSRQLSGKRAVSLAMAARMANLTDIPVERLVNTPETARLVKLLGIHREVA